jgi:methionyl aminopeptidase
MTIETGSQFESMGVIGAIVANCLEYMKSKAKPGMTTRELDELGERFLEKVGAHSAPKSTYDFPGATCISVEKQAAHGIPGDYVLKDGDLVNIDVSAEKDGFYADNGESFVVGKGNKIKLRLVNAVGKALMLGIGEARADRQISCVGGAVETFAKKNGFTVIRNLGGHGVGKSLHEEPEFIASFHNKRDRRLFKANQVVAIEPFLSNGASTVKEAKDGWTLYHDKFYSVQKEHTIMITKKEAHIFTIPTKNF